MSEDFQGTTWRYIAEDKTLHSYHFENLKFAMIYILFTLTRGKEENVNTTLRWMLGKYSMYVTVYTT
jgi:hypothetical protein